MTVLKYSKRVLLTEVFPLIGAADSGLGVQARGI